jgi:UDP-N-acetyl-2-amino-2-deoxyglucuronate dehydrogenase
MDSLKIAVIGTGLIAGSFKFASKFVKNVKITACCDVKENLAKKFAGHAMPYFLKSEDLYKNADFDAVYLALPHFLHRPMIEEALDAGKDVFCEKPLTTNLEDANAIIAKAKQLNRKIGVMYQYRYDTRCYQLAKACQSGHLGELYWGKVEVPWLRNEKYFQQGDWRRTWEKSGGGNAIDPC